MKLANKTFKISILKTYFRHTHSKLQNKIIKNIHNKKQISQKKYNKSSIKNLSKSDSSMSKKYRIYNRN